MRERLITLAGGLVALAIVVMLVWSPRPVEDKRVSRPTTEDRGKHGLAALKHWLDADKVPTISLRERYETLVQNPSLPARGNLLITVLPHATVTRKDEADELISWLSQGNSILVLAAQSDSPSWIRHAEGDSIGVFLNRLGFDWYVDEPDDSDQESHAKQPALPKPEMQQWVFSGGAHPLSQDLKHIVVHASDDDGTGIWVMTGSHGTRQPLPLLFFEPTHSPVLWQARVGEGTAWISRYSDFFGNATLGEGDNARFFERLVNRAVAPDGRVIFDDMHQGLSILYDAKAFFSDDRFLHTLLFLVALWVVYLLGHTNRFIPARARNIAPDLATETRAAGGVFARHVADHAVARRLLRHFHHEIRAMHHLPGDGQPVWDLLARNARVDPWLVAQLQRAQQRAEAGRTVNLVRLTHLMIDIREALQ